MPIDPNIALSIKPMQIENPLINMLRFAQIQQAMNENDMAPMKMEAAKLQLEKNKQINSLLPQVFGGDNSWGGDQSARVQAALSQGAAAGDVGPTVNNANRLSSLVGAANPSGFNLTALNKLSALGYDTKQMFDQYKYINDGVKRDANAYYKNPLTGETEYFADPKSGINFNPKTGEVAALPGFAQANASIKGAETEATERVKAGYQPLPLGYVGQDGRPIGGSVGEYLNPGLNNPRTPGAPTVSVGQQRPGQGGVAAQMDFGKLNSYIDQVKSSGDPNTISTFRNAVLVKLGDITDPAARSQAIAGFLSHMDAPAGAAISPQQGAAAGGGRPLLQSEAERKQQVGQVELTQGAQGEVNKNWIANSHNPVLKAGTDAQSAIDSLTVLRNINPQTGWGEEAKASAANVLVGLGIASNQAEKMASDFQKFQSVSMERLWQQLNQAKGPQTEGDADRAKATYAQYRNTPQANQYIMDVMQAKANQDIKRAQYYQEALPLAIQEGNLSKVDQMWNKIKPSLWSDPILQQYVKKGGK